MAKKERTPEEKLKGLIVLQEREYARWKQLYTQGGSDPFYADGDNLYLVRNHIIYGKIKAKELCEEHGIALPKVFEQELPQEVDRAYMARQPEILVHALQASELLSQDKNYQYLKQQKAYLTQKQINDSCIKAVLNYVNCLKNAIEEKDYVVMRRYENPKSYIEALRSCAEKVLNMEPEQVQLSLFA